ncbi:hypothetical protein P9112_008278 [Eukaryota sp. TZLM1-RC]
MIDVNKDLQVAVDDFQHPSVSFRYLRPFFSDGFIRRYSGVLYGILLLQSIGFVTQTVEFHAVLDLKAIFSVISVPLYHDTVITPTVSFWIVSSFILLCGTILLSFALLGLLDSNQQTKSCAPKLLKTFGSVLYITLTTCCIPFTILLLSFIRCGLDTSHNPLITQVIPTSSCSSPWEIARRFYALFCLLVLLFATFFRFTTFHQFSPLSKDKFAISHPHALCYSVASFFVFIFVLFSFPYRFYLIRSCYMLSAAFSLYHFYTNFPFYSVGATLISATGLGMWLGNAFAFFIYSVYTQFRNSNSIFNLVLFLFFYLFFGGLCCFLFNRKYNSLYQCIERVLDGNTTKSIEIRRFPQFNSMLNAAYSLQSEPQVLNFIEVLLAQVEATFSGFEMNYALISSTIYHLYVSKQLTLAKTKLNSLFSNDSDKSVFVNWMISFLNSEINEFRASTGQQFAALQSMEHTKLKLVNRIDSSFHHCLSVVASFWDSLLKKNVDLNKVSDILHDLHVSRERTFNYFSQYFAAGYEDYPVVVRFSWFIRDIHLDDTTADILDSTAAALIAGKQNFSESGSAVGSVLSGSSIHQSICSAKTTKILGTQKREKKKGLFLKVSMYATLALVFVVFVVLGLFGLIWLSQSSKFSVHAYELSHAIQLSLNLPTRMLEYEFSNHFDLTMSIEDLNGNFSTLLASQSQHLAFHLTRLATKTDPSSGCPRQEFEDSPTLPKSLSRLFSLPKVISIVKFPISPQSHAAFTTSLWQQGLSYCADVGLFADHLTYPNPNPKFESSFVFGNARQFSTALVNFYNELFSFIFNLYSNLSFYLILTGIVVFLVFFFIVLYISSTAFQQIINQKTAALNAYLLFPKDDPSNALVLQSARFTIREILLSIDDILLKNMPRNKVINVLRKTLMKNKRFLCVWAGFEPDQYDDADFSCPQGHDVDKRFVPMVFRDSGRVEVGAMPEIDKEEFYKMPKETLQFYKTNPFNYDFGSFTANLITVSAPIFQFGHFVGAVGLDVLIGDVDTSDSDDIASRNNFESVVNISDDKTSMKKSSTKCFKGITFFFSLFLVVSSLFITVSFLNNNNQKFEIFQDSVRLSEFLDDSIRFDGEIFASRSFVRKFAVAGNPLFLHYYALSTRVSNFRNQISKYLSDLNNEDALGLVESSFEKLKYLEKITLFQSVHIHNTNPEVSKFLSNFTYNFDDETDSVATLVKYPNTLFYSNNEDDLYQFNSSQLFILSKDIISSNRFFDVLKSFLDGKNQVFDSIRFNISNDSQQFLSFLISRTSLKKYAIVSSILVSLLAMISYYFQSYSRKTKLVTFVLVVFIISCFSYLLYSNNLTLNQLKLDNSRLEEQSLLFEVIADFQASFTTMIHFFELYSLQPELYYHEINRALTEFEHFFNHLSTSYCDRFESQKSICLELLTNLAEFELFDLIKEVLLFSCRLVSIVEVSNESGHLCFQSRFDWDATGHNFDESLKNSSHYQELPYVERKEIAFELIFGLKFDELMRNVMDEIQLISSQLSSAIFEEAKISYHISINFTPFTISISSFILVTSLLLYTCSQFRQFEDNSTIVIKQNLKDANIANHKRRFVFVIFGLFVVFFAGIVVLLWFNPQSTTLFVFMDSLAKVSLDLEDIEYSMLQSILNKELFSISFDKLTALSHEFNLHYNKLVELSQYLNAEVIDLLYSSKFSTTDTHSGFAYYYHSVSSFVQQYLANFGNSNNVASLINSTASAREILLRVHDVVLGLGQSLVRSTKIVVFLVCLLGLLGISFGFVLFRSMLVSLQQEQDTVVSLLKMLPEEAVERIPELSKYLHSVGISK